MKAIYDLPSKPPVVGFKNEGGIRDDFNAVVRRSDGRLLAIFYLEADAQEFVGVGADQVRILRHVSIDRLTIGSQARRTPLNSALS